MASMHFAFRVMDAQRPVSCADVAELYLDGEPVICRALWAFTPSEPDKAGPGVVRLLALNEAGALRIRRNGEVITEKRAGIVSWTRKGES